MRATRIRLRALATASVILASALAVAQAAPAAKRASAAKTAPAVANRAPAKKQFFNPEGLSKPPGYTHAVSVQGGRLVLIAGQVALDASGQVVGKDDLRAQVQKAFENLKMALAAAGATPADIVKVNYYVVNYSAEQHLAMLREVRSHFLPQENPPASTLIGVQALAQPDLLIEIEALAAVP